VTANTLFMPDFISPATMTNKQKEPDSEPRPAAGSQPSPAETAPKEINGPKGPEPTRFGDWEHKGRCSDF